MIPSISWSPAKIRGTQFTNFGNYIANSLNIIRSWDFRLFDEILSRSHFNAILAHPGRRSQRFRREMI